MKKKPAPPATEGISDDDLAAIRSVFEEQFGPGLLRDLQVTSDLDHYGDPVLLIRFVVDDVRVLSPKITVGMIDQLRSRLLTDAFPSLSYMSKSDAHELMLEPV